MSQPDAAYWIQQLGLEKHPEGGWFRETYRSREMLPNAGLPDRFTGPRPVATSIYFLLESGEPSHLHRFQSDEIWNYHAGGSLTLYILHADGSLETKTLGPDGDFQAVVPAGVWFGAKVNEPATYCLAGCSVAPGFDFADFELGDRDQLMAEFPRHAQLIHGLTQSN